ncbi:MULTISPECIES: hypothetical protein [Rhizobium/Agrobacterium group]|jgi:hypothetical protein|uniref:Uncharacterized protein n=1 Tax=Rhizobium soli TaxID=424798 RepID=A0A7X0JME7_9HYPH|nr:MULTISPECIES: hypothetical protein [Rhizobium/Agrobacterium group]MBB6509392.1 hypothetical protein [Rhizobium soli]MBD8650130.1 hypothetical protein [Rhizobium sp. CFBP 13726]MBD8663461.1 hypothetical protein [Rhizobium sp. CFBP 8752]MBP2460822.1 hypothetical protein [Rhizobium sp. PvP014]MBP2528218.1 hypothetical protein [Rhizobium sp. PvP099]
MGKVLMWIGWIGIVLVVCALVALMASAGQGSYALLALLAALPWAAPAFIGSVLVAAFGSMLLQLNAIRAATERQAELFAQLLDGKKKRDAAVEA